MTSHVVVAIAPYSASAVDRATTYCFLDHHVIGESPNKTQYPVTDFLESAHRSQSLSQYAVSVGADFEERRIS